MDQRLLALLIGAAAGFIAGYLVRSIREIKEKVDRVDEHVTHRNNHDAGTITTGMLTRIGLFLVVAMTAYSAIISQISANKSNDNTEDLKRVVESQKQVVSCVEDYLAQTITALNERTKFSASAATANTDLQKAFNLVVTASLRNPPPTKAEGRKIVEDYAKALQHFLDISAKNQAQVLKNDYPKAADLAACIANPKVKHSK